MISKYDAEHIREALARQMNLLAEQLTDNTRLIETIMRIGEKVYSTNHPNPQVRRRPDNAGDCEVEVESLCKYFMAYRTQLHTCLRWAWADIISKMLQDKELNDGDARRVIEIEDTLGNIGNIDIPSYARPNLDTDLRKRALEYVNSVREKRIGRCPK